uniref:Uncharacterized protein n=1 Tax=Siphoviridae sp. ctX5W26 TaxID=2825540 RepID=A0A8S5UEN3_9CAUD|nr:MAG TPA: hypothetical protein [Siphoviridae sp. ctX5W26]
MHCCIHLLTKQSFTDMEIEKILVNNSRNKRLFHSALLSESKRNAKVPFAYAEESYFPNMEYYDGYILVDGARQKDILNLDELECFGCVLPDGSAIARELWTGNGFVEDDEFEEKYKKAVADNMDGFLTVLDIHEEQTNM